MAEHTTNTTEDKSKSQQSTASEIGSWAKSVKEIWAALAAVFSFIGVIVAWVVIRRNRTKFERLYLRSLVVDLRDLTLPGITPSEDINKRPKLEQVFISLRLGAPRENASTRDVEHLVDFILKTQRIEQGDSAIPDLRARLERLDPGDFKSLERTLLQEPGSPRAKELIDELLAVALEPVAHPFNSPDGTHPLGPILRDHAQVCILGSPGSGKSTILQYIALAYARKRVDDRRLRERRALRTRLGLSKWKLPIYARLSGVAEKLRGGGKTLVDVLPELVPYPDTRQHIAAADYLRRRIEAGGCILLLDGLDEVADQADFKRVVEAIEGCAVAYGENRFVVTSRVAGWRSGVGADFRVFHVEDMNDEQIRLFIETWYQVVERNAVLGRLTGETVTERETRERKARQRAETLITALAENRPIRRLAKNPMLLAIIAVVHRNAKTLPKGRSALYKNCTDLLLDRWDQDKGIRLDDTKLSLPQKELLMRRVAIALHSGIIGDPAGGREAPRTDVEKEIGKQLPEFGRQTGDAPQLLSWLIERSGLINEPRLGVVAFVHHTFQEFFAAQHLAAGDKPIHRDFLANPARTSSEWWREVLLLYAGSVPDASDLLKSLTAGSGDDLCQIRLRLASLCLGEAVSIGTTQVRKGLIDRLLRVRCRGQLAELPRSAPPEIEEYLVSSADEDDWFDLAAADSVRTRLAAGEELVLRQNILDALNSIDLRVRRAGVNALTRLPQAQIHTAYVGPILENLDPGQRDSVTRARAAAAVKTLAHVGVAEGPRFAATLWERLGDRSSSIVKEVREALAEVGKLQSDAFLADLTSNIRAGALDRETAAFVLADQILDNSKRVPPELIRIILTLRRGSGIGVWILLQRDDSGVVLDAVLDRLKSAPKEEAESLLGDLRYQSQIADADRIYDGIERFLLGDDEAAREKAVEIFKFFKRDEQAAWLVRKAGPLLARPEPTAQIAALSMVAAIESGAVDPILEQVLAAARATDHRVRAAAAKALACCGAVAIPRVWNVLLGLASDPEPLVRYSAIVAFTRVASHGTDLRAPDALEVALGDSCDAIRVAAARGIATVGESARTPTVSKALGRLLARRHWWKEDSPSRDEKPAPWESEAYQELGGHYQAAAVDALIQVTRMEDRGNLLEEFLAIVERRHKLPVRWYALHGIAQLVGPADASQTFDRLAVAARTDEAIFIPWIESMAKQASSPLWGTAHWWTLIRYRNETIPFSQVAAQVGTTDFVSRVWPLVSAHPQSKMRVFALLAISYLRSNLPDDAIDQNLQSAMRDESSEVRSWAVAVASNIANETKRPRVLRLLSERLTDNVRSVRVAAWRAVAGNVLGVKLD